MKTNKTGDQNKGNIYDRIFKENARELFLPLVERRLGIEIVSYEALPEKIQKTTEREADFLYKIKTSEEEVSLLHIEFQNKNDPKMLGRMAEYHGLFYRKYKLPIHHVVIYLGKRKSTMKSRLPAAEVFRGFDLISVYDMDTNDFLSSQVPSVIMLALLTNFKTERKESILRLVLRKIKAHSKHENDLKKYLEQLLILARIRKLEDITEKIIEDMPITYDIEKDGLYKKGLLKGIEQGIEQGIERGMEQGEKQGEKKGTVKGIEQTLLVIQCLKEGKTIKETAILTELTQKQVRIIKNKIS